MGGCRLLFIPTAEFIRLVLEQEPAAVKVMGRLGQLMVRRLQERDADLLRWLESQDAAAAGSEVAPTSRSESPSWSSALLEYTALRKRLMSDWALQYHALEQSAGNQCAASKQLGIHRNTLQRKMQEFGIGNGRPRRKPAARVVRTKRRKNPAA